MATSGIGDKRSRNEGEQIAWQSFVKRQRMYDEKELRSIEREQALCALRIHRNLAVTTTCDTYKELYAKKLHLLNEMEERIKSVDLGILSPERTRVLEVISTYGRVKSIFLNKIIDKTVDTEEEDLNSWMRGRHMGDFTSHWAHLAAKQSKRSEEAEQKEKIRIALDAAFMAYIYVSSEENKKRLGDMVEKYYVKDVDLPPEIWAHIFSFLSSSDLLAASGVTKDWQKIIIDQKHIKKTIHKERLVDKNPSKVFSCTLPGLKVDNVKDLAVKGYVLLEDHFIIYLRVPKGNGVSSLGKMTHFNLKKQETSVVTSCPNYNGHVGLYRIAANQFLVVPQKERKRFMIGTLSAEGKLDFKTLTLRKTSQIDYWKEAPHHVFGMGEKNIFYEFDLKSETQKEKVYGTGQYTTYVANSSYFARYDESNTLHIFSRETQDEIELPDEIKNSNGIKLTENAVYSEKDSKLMRFDLRIKKNQSFQWNIDKDIAIVIEEWQNMIFFAHGSTLKLFDLAAEKEKWSVSLSMTSTFGLPLPTITPRQDYIIVESPKQCEFESPGFYVLDWETGSTLAYYPEQSDFSEEHFIKFNSIGGADSSSTEKLEIEISRF